MMAGLSNLRDVSKGVVEDNRSAGAAEQRVAFRQEVTVRLEMVGARHVDASALKALQPVQEHPPVDPFQHVEPDGDLEVRRDRAPRK